MSTGFVRFSVPGEVVPWARAGGHGHLRFTPQKQRNYMAVLKQYAADAMDGRPLFDCALDMTVTAIWPWPKSMSAKKRAEAGTRLKRTTPDADNITKIIKDALNLVVFTDDARISDLHVHKRFGDYPGVTVEVKRAVDYLASAEHLAALAPLGAE